MASASPCPPSRQLWPAVGSDWPLVVGSGSVAVAAKCQLWLPYRRKSRPRFLYRPRGGGRRPVAPPPLFPTLPVQVPSAAKLRKHSSFVGTWKNLLQEQLSADYAVARHLSRKKRR